VTERVEGVNEYLERESDINEREREREDNVWS